MNKVILIGRLTKDPTLRKTQSSVSVTSFTLAVDNRRGGANSETLYIDCVAWNVLADMINNYAKKGSLVAVDGRLGQRSYTNNAGAKVTKYEITVEGFEFVGPRQGGKAGDNSSVVELDETNLDSDPTIEDDLPFTD